MPDPDFVVDISGSDITPYLMGWKLHHTDEGVSNIVVKIANHDHMYSGVFSMDDELSIIFGHSDHLGEKIQMTVKGVSEMYQRGLPTISVVAKDDCCELNSKTIKGHAPEGIDPKQVSERMGKKLGPNNRDLNIKHPDGQPPKTSKDFRIPLPGTSSAGVMLSHLGNMLYFPKAYSVDT
jgi:hypothetical protein